MEKVVNYRLQFCAINLGVVHTNVNDLVSRNGDRLDMMIAEQADRCSFETFAVLPNVVFAFLAPQIKQTRKFKLGRSRNRDLVLLNLYADAGGVVAIGIIKVLHEVAGDEDGVPVNTPSGRHRTVACVEVLDAIQAYFLKVVQTIFPGHSYPIIGLSNREVPAF